jgi:type I restriction enzyme R subunit
LPENHLQNYRVPARNLIATFRNSYNPRIVVTVDMIATGTDIKPVEVVFFMRNIRSRNFFEQMKGRGVRVISDTEFKSVTPDALHKTRFVIIDAVGVTESDLSDSYSLEKQPGVSFEKLLDAVSMGNREPEVITSLASRLARLDRQLSPRDRHAIQESAGGVPLTELVSALVEAVDPDAALDQARQETGQDNPPESVVLQARRALIEQAARPFAANPGLRQRLIDIRKSYEQTIDTVSPDQLIEAGYSADAADHARTLVQSFEGFIQEHRDEITALQVLYSRPYRQRLTYKDIKALADALQLPPRSWTPDRLWQAYQQLDHSKVRGSGQRVLADVVSLVRYAVGEDEELVPFAEQVRRRFEGWLAMQETAGRRFTTEQRQWLAAIRDHIAGSVSMGLEDFQYAPFDQRGGLARAYTLFGEDLGRVLKELNVELVA